ncbi:gliding motility-associated C-terminal domain-containing protein [Hymenobacter edaphi]|uniref:PKD-like domain-containing protein n=1 Tax=Hymenobacter edaphi TaxID=2211146 RepID=A0A328B9L6_9BACT|nr:gliding motility-associated C-terminal domain-containing protein [Hymenobacter edaphi]RAK63823.1 hypothetical protein DLM85_19935 [Hymenobacter edaphi]
MSAYSRRAGLLLLVWLGVGLLSAAANHLMGGELTYRYLGALGATATPHRYELTARIYSDSLALPAGSPVLPITLYAKSAGRPILLSVSVPRLRSSLLPPSVAGGCTPGGWEVTLTQYVTVVDLPAVAEGYAAAATLSYRSGLAQNLATPERQLMSLTADLAPGGLPNASPVFADRATVQICLGDTSVVLNNAYDADGDRLSYRLGTPTGSVTSLSTQPVAYAAGYSAATPFGASGYAAIEARTGVARYRSQRQGNFALALDVSEYRVVNGQEVLLGTTRRDILVLVAPCTGPVNAPPVLTTTPARRDFQVLPGQTLNVALTATDPEAQPLRMTVSSVLLDGPGLVDAAVNGQPGNGSPAAPVGRVLLSGPGPVTGSFQLRASCAQARPEPYDVVVTVDDGGCSRHLSALVLRITVLEPPAPGRIVGDSVVCADSDVRYAVAGPAASSYQWTVTGGQIQGVSTGSTVLVRWPGGGGTGTVAARATLGPDCRTAAALRPVVIEPRLAIAGPAVYCRTANTGLRYQVGGPPARYQWSISGGRIVSGQATSEVTVDVAPGAGATLRVVHPDFAGCGGDTFRIGEDNTCLYFYNIITPNGDGQNDTFVIENVERHPHTALTLYSRWGQLLYQSADYRNTYDGEGAGAGVYYYHCRLADGTVYKGWLEIVR